MFLPASSFSLYAWNQSSPSTVFCRTTLAITGHGGLLSLTSWKTTFSWESVQPFLSAFSKTEFRQHHVQTFRQKKTDNSPNVISAILAMILHRLEVSDMISQYPSRKDADRLIQSSVFTGQCHTCVGTHRNNTKSDMQSIWSSELHLLAADAGFCFFPRRDGKSFAELLLDGKKNNDRERNKHYNFTHSDYYASPPLRKNNNASSIKEEGKKNQKDIQFGRRY